MMAHSSPSSYQPSYGYPLRYPYVMVAPSKSPGYFGILAIPIAIPLVVIPMAIPFVPRQAAWVPSCFRRGALWVIPSSLKKSSLLIYLPHKLLQSKINVWPRRSSELVPLQVFESKALSLTNLLPVFGFQAFFVWGYSTKCLFSNPKIPKFGMSYFCSFSVDAGKII